MAAKLKENEICVVILIGLPGSGKSTLSTTLVKFLNNLSHNIVHYAIPICYDELISPDVFRYLDDSSQWKNARKEVLKNVKKLICVIKRLEKYDSRSELIKIISQEQLLQIIKFEKAKRIFIIVDDNMYYRSMRYEYYQLARLFSLSFCQLYIECSVYDAVTHNAIRDITVPEDTIPRMANKLEPPDKQNTWEKFSLTIPSEIWSIEKITEIFSFLNDAMEHPVRAADGVFEVRQESRAICSANVMHQVDILLRKLVGEKIKEMNRMNVKREELQTQCRILADCKHSMLERIKMGDVMIPNEICENLEFNQSVAKDQLNQFLRNLFNH